MHQDLGSADPRALSLVNWLLDHQETSAGWSWRPGMEPSWIASTAFALLALRSALSIDGAPVSEIDTSARSALSWLGRIRNPDGGWGSREGDRSRAAVTGLAMFAMSVFGLRAEAAEAKASLLAGYHESNDWPDTIDRPTGHTVTRWGAPCALIGISTTFEPPDATVVTSLLRSIMRSHRGGPFQYRDSVMHTWPTRDALLGLAAALRIADASEVRPGNGLPGSAPPAGSSA
jgi:hypothetical protein